jgi:hypothetical protein
MKVKFWPKDNSIPASVCSHRHGAVMTFSQETDTRKLNSVFAMELYGFRNNIRLGCNTSNIEGDYQSGMAAQEETGLIRFDIYFMIDSWVNPFTGTLETIPDYGATEWTSAGAAVFSTIAAGQSKTTDYPNHGQEMYDVSGGAYGYDYSNSVSGTSNQAELIGVINYMNDWLSDIIGRKPSAASFRIGMTNCYPSLIPYFLGVRNSDPLPAVLAQDCDTYYGISSDGIHLGLPNDKPLTRNSYANFPSSSRWWDMWNGEGFTEDEAKTYLSDQITKTLANNGWFRDFAHWHNPITAGNMPEMDVMLALVRTTVGSDFIHTCSNGEALEYMFLRTLAKRARAVEKTDGVYIIVDIVDGFKGTNTEGIDNAVNYPTINIPLSVQVDLSSTSLTGKTVQSNYGKMRSMGNDIYIVEIPFSTKSEAFQGIKIMEGIANIYDESVPTGTATISNGQVNVTTNIKTKAVLFGVVSGGNDFESVDMGRSNDFNTTHSIAISDDTMDYRVGVISEFGQAALITI